MAEASVQLSEASFCGQDCSLRSSNLPFFVQHGIQQEGVDLKVAVVVDVAQLPKPIHKVAHAGAGRTNHVRERPLADIGDDRLAVLISPPRNQNNQKIASCRAIFRFRRIQRK
jgi:hypothetical protein